MANFWDDVEKSVTGKFESGGGSFALIPDNTNLIAAINTAEWKEFQGDEYINIRWDVLAPYEYKNRVLFQKIKVYDTDEKKANKAKRMLSAIDTNAGGKLAMLKEAPTDSQLLKALQNKVMVIKVFTWDMGEKSGNWVGAVSPKVEVKKEIATEEYDDDIPY